MPPARPVRRRSPAPRGVDLCVDALISGTPGVADWYLWGMAGESARERAQRAREKSQRLARYAEQWEKGADGESATAAALANLGAEWTCWHDLHWPGRRFANIDHLAIGPAGIFVIDSKNWSGTLTAKEDVLRQGGYRRETAVAACADSALAVGELLPRYLDRVWPVLCFTREEPVDGWARDVMLCSTATVVARLTGRPTVLDAGEIADAVLTLQARMRSKATPPPRPRTAVGAPALEAATSAPPHGPDGRDADALPDRASPAQALPQAPCHRGRCLVAGNHARLPHAGADDALRRQRAWPHHPRPRRPQLGADAPPHQIARARSTAAPSPGTWTSPPHTGRKALTDERSGSNGARSGPPPQRHTPSELHRTDRIDPDRAGSAVST